MSVAILQNSVGIGGRSKVISSVVSLLTQHDIQVEIFTLSSSSEIKEFVDHYNLDKNKIGIKRYPNKYPTNTQYGQLLLNYLCRNDISNYKLVFNSNNCLQFLPKNVDYIHYIHFPNPSISEKDFRYSSKIYLFSTTPIILLNKLNTPSITNPVIANSRYTKKIVENTYEIKNVDVLYPPAVDRVKPSTFYGSGVISVGSVHPNKRQLFQIKIAQRFPEIQFTIVGSISNSRYYQKCKNLMNKKGISNVTFTGRISDLELEKRLAQNKIFFHTMKNEPFGISTVEGINNGCIPIVHNSGGQKEIVKDQFRFDTLDDCVNIFESVLYNDSQYGSDKNIDVYTEPEFQTSLKSKLYETDLF